MNGPPTDETSKPRVVLRRRPNDFSHRGVVLLQPGCCCCCCCCCLHWIGAAGGAVWGTVAACRMGEKATTLADAFAQRCTYWGAFLGALVWAPLLIGTGAISAAVDFTDDIFNLLLITLAFAPSVAVLTVGAGALLGAWIGVCFAPRTSKGYLPRRVSGAWSLAWRIAWRTFLYSTCGSGLGYLAMYLIYVIADRIS